MTASACGQRSVVHSLPQLVVVWSYCGWREQAVEKMFHNVIYLVKQLVVGVFQRLIERRQVWRKVMMMMMMMMMMQVSAGFQSNQQLQQQMQADKSLCTVSVRELEARLLDVQDRLMQKVREVAAAREVQTSLRTEIESYKALIECQEKK